MTKTGNHFCKNCEKCIFCVCCTNCISCLYCEYCKGCVDCEKCINVIGGINLRGIKFDKPTRVDKYGNPVITHKQEHSLFDVLEDIINSQDTTFNLSSPEYVIGYAKSMGKTIYLDQANKIIEVGNTLIFFMKNSKDKLDVYEKD